MAYIQTGELLLRRGFITRDQLEFCLRVQASATSALSRKKIGEIILEYRFANESSIERAILDASELKNTVGENASLSLLPLPLTLIKKLQIIPISLAHGVLKIAAAGVITGEDKKNIIAAASDANMTVSSIDVVPCDRMTVLKSTGLITIPDQATVAAELYELKSKIDDHVFVTQVIEHIFTDAIQSRASDIHFVVVNELSRTSRDDLSKIGHRVDGKMRYLYLVDNAVMAIIATRIKADAGIEYSETKMPHDGHALTTYNGKKIDLRISTMPDEAGERIVIRLLDPDNVPSIEDIFSLYPPIARGIKNLMAIEQKTGGIFLLTGPTGSGKSSTLNAIISGINRASVSVRTVEDPVELRIPLVGHTQVNEAIGLTYAIALRALLRQDPDVIMVGELRDEETVEIALRGSETGHKLYSTLHTGNVSESITRLMGMMNSSLRERGKYILAGNLKGVINQKLCRRVCTKCQIELPLDHKDYQAIIAAFGGRVPKRLSSGAGCSRCDNTGLYGRIIVPEAVFFSGDNKTKHELEQILINNRPFREAFELKGAVWFSRQDAVFSAIEAGMIDADTALSVMDMDGRER